MSRSASTAVVTILALLACPIAVGHAQANQRVVKAFEKQGGAAQLPSCKGGFGMSGKVGDGVADLRSAMDTKDSARRDNSLASAQKNLVAAAVKDPKSTPAWLYLGRTYLFRGDLAGADSAFTRALAASPDCKDDINRFREAAWVPLVNDGVDFSQAKKDDSALALFREANQIYREKPNGLAGAGVIYANTGQIDSAAVYLKLAADVAAKANLNEDRNGATYNLGLVLLRSKKYDEAVAALEQYHTWVPKDTLGARSLASAYRAAGKTDQAAATEKAAGIAPGSVPGGDQGTLQFNEGVNLFNQNKFADAATLFGQVYEKQPYNHDALLNQATAYYKAQDAVKLAAVGEKLVDVEPMNEVAMQLLSQAYKTTKQQDKQVAMVTRYRAMPIKVETKQVTISPTAIQLTLMATGRDAKDPKDAPIKPAPVTLVFEVMGTDGAVLGTQEVTVPPLNAGATQEIKVDVKANGIAGWHYKAK